MDFSFVYHFIQVLSLPLTFILIIVYKDHKNHPTIACYSGTLFLQSLVSGLVGFIRVIQSSQTEQNVICSFQGALMTYVLLALDIWPVCIALNVWIQFNPVSLQERERCSNRKILFIYMIISWGIPIILSLAVLINSSMNGGMIPWPNYCMPAPTTFFAAIFFICVVAIITTLALSVRDVLLTIKYDTGQLSDNLVVVDNSLNKRIAIFGIAITAPFFIISIASIISFLIENRLNFVWVISADFAMSTMPWITFVFFGTTSEATRKYLPRCCFPQENRNNIPVKPSTINQSLRKSINVPSLPSREPSPDDLTIITREIKNFPQTPQLNFGMPSGSTVSTFSQRAGPNSTDPFSHRKNPSLTIKIDPIEPANGSKIINFRTSRIRKGKERMTTLRKSFLRKTNTDDSIDNYNYLSGSVNKYSSKNKKIDVSRGKSSAFYETATPNRRSPRNTIIKENKIEKCEFLDETKNYLLKQFSFEKRQKSESIIEIPSEFGIKTHSQNSSLSIQTDNHIISQPSISQMITMDNSQNIVPLSQSENMISGREAELKNKQIEITVGGSLTPQIGLSVPPHKTSKESLKEKAINNLHNLHNLNNLNNSPNIYLTVNNESSSSTNATFGSKLTSKSIELTGTNNSFLDQDYAESSNNNHLDHSPSLGLPSTPSFGTMAMHSTTSRTNTQSSSSSSKSSKTTVTNNRSSTGTTRSSNGFTLTPRGSRAFNNAMRLVIGNDNGSSSPALDDENEQRMRELRQIVEEFDDQTSFKSPNSSQ
ncbi:hypothetical protein F8M41_003784 [Gigaspora margarita]|uniref:G-protein coupled receptors family 2 profile 2 domain-containing protein n=1 Tax=Gigaspora margarita TaxID=4874 RepID=A0A8H4A7H0_GIGMA|nr:hypothetical protein F8M41_003784 [Gigaspora margarita]